MINTISSTAYAPASSAKGKDIDLAWQRANGCGVVPAPALEQYLDGILGKLQNGSPIHNAPAQVHVLASHDWGATTTADANIYVNLGLLDQLESEDEVAAVLAHELVHALRNHNDSDVVEDLQRRAFLLSRIAFEVKDRVDNGGAEKKGSSKPDSLLKNEWYGLQANMRILSPAWNRTQEQEADLLGVDLLAAAGYCTCAMRTVLQKQQEWEKQAAAQPQTTGTDPQLDALVNSLVGNSKNAEAATPNTAPDLKDVGKSILKNIIKSTTTSMASTHPDTAERLRVVAEYSSQYYREAEQRTPAADALKKMRGTKEIKTIFTNYSRAFEAMDKLRDGNAQEAEKLASLGTAGSTAKHSCPAYVLASVRTAQGKQAEAMKLLESTFGSAEPALLTYKEAAKIQMQGGKTKEALALLERANREFKEPPAFFPDLIRAYHKVGRNDDASSAVLRCATKYPRYEDACRQANEDKRSAN
ncbi:MAG: M48 family metalloprotease [Deltaproteobacteria bacterium]|nr:M48 family metalloprotease [Deltaproteobacteria bacterium]